MDETLTMDNKKEDEFSLLSNISSACAESADFEQLFDSILAQLLPFIGYDTAEAMLLDKKLQSASIVFSYGNTAKVSNKQIIINTTEEPYKQIFSGGTVLYVNKSSAPYSELAVKHEVSSILFIPLRSKGKVNGCLRLFSFDKSIEADDKLNELLYTIGNIIGTSMSNLINDENVAKWAHKVEENIRLKQEDIYKARQLQNNLNTLYTPVSSSVNVKAAYFPSEILGGDFFMIKQEQEKIFIISADCVGHGIEAAMNAALIKAICDRFFKYLSFLSIDKFLKKVNETILEYFNGHNYPTMFVAIINSSNGELFYGSANSTHPIIVTENGVKKLQRAQGFYLGYDENASFEMKISKLTEGDKLVFYSDALFDMEVNDSIFGIDGVLELVEHSKKYNDAMIERSIELIKEIHGYLPLEDDLTIITAEYKARETAKSYTFYGMNEMSNAVSAVESLMKDYSFESYEVLKAVVAFKELFKNAYYHGNKENDKKQIAVEIKINSKRIEIGIEDEGKGFSLGDLPNPMDYEELINSIEDGDEGGYLHGRGIWLAQYYLTKLQYQNSGAKAVATLEKKAQKVIDKLPRVNERLLG